MVEKHCFFTNLSIREAPPPDDNYVFGNLLMADVSYPKDASAVYFTSYHTIIS